MTALFSAVIRGRGGGVWERVRDCITAEEWSRGRWGAWWALFADRDALRCGVGAVVDVLLAMGCDRGARDLHGVDAVRCARYFGRMDVVRRLLGGGTIVESGVDECADDKEEVRKRYRSVTATQFQLRLDEGCVFIDQD